MPLPLAKSPSLHSTIPFSISRPCLYLPVGLVSEPSRFPRNLTNPHTIPNNVTNDPLYFPSAIANLTTSGKEAVVSSVIAQIGSIITSSEFGSNCSKCIAGLNVAKTAALLAPEMVPDAMVALCKQYKLHSNTTCEVDFDASTFGVIWTQVLALADLASEDGQYICNRFVSCLLHCDDTNRVPISLALEAALIVPHQIHSP